LGEKDGLRQGIGCEGHPETFSSSPDHHSLKALHFILKEKVPCFFSVLLAGVSGHFFLLKKESLNSDSSPEAKQVASCFAVSGLSVKKRFCGHF